MKKGVLRNFTKFTGKHLSQSLSFNNAAGLRPIIPPNLAQNLNQIKRIFVLQRKLLRIIYFQYRNAHISPLFKILDKFPYS